MTVKLTRFLRYTMEMKTIGFKLRVTINGTTIGFTIFKILQIKGRKWYGVKFESVNQLSITTFNIFTIKPNTPKTTITAITTFFNTLTTYNSKSTTSGHRRKSKKSFLPVRPPSSGRIELKKKTYY